MQCHWTDSRNNDVVAQLGPKSSAGKRTVRVSNNRRCVVMQRFILSAKACFSTCVAGQSSRDTGLCLQHLSDLLVMTVHTGNNTHTLMNTHETEEVTLCYSIITHHAGGGARILRSTHTCSHGLVSVINMHAQK